MSFPFSTVLVANRGVIALRILRTVRRLGLRGVAVYSQADAGALHVAAADDAVLLGGPAPKDSYLDAGKIIEAARRTGAGAIHPGYGFLAENAAFAEACEAAGLTFVGPTPAQIRAFGLKHTARALAADAGLPLLPGTGLLPDLAAAHDAARRIGYPVMLKSTAGGGGIGMRRCDTPADLGAAFDSVARLAASSFRDAGLYLEKVVDPARHVEVQIFGDGAGRVLALGQRDCSAQRRNQKVIEEAPPPGLGPETRAALDSAAVRLGESARYRSAGTVEMLVDAQSGESFFLEVNTRIQVEHGVTEEVTGIDLVEWMLRVAAGQPLPAGEAPPTRGAAMQARIYAEDPARGFRPSSGVLTEASFPEGGPVRVETAVDRGTEVTPYYDPLLCKLIARGDTREEARVRLLDALDRCRIAGVESNRDYLAEVLRAAAFAAGAVHTRMLEDVRFVPATIEVLDGGTQTTVQDFPGRLGHWDVGVPPSGPMDALSFRLGNRLVGNASGAAGLECTLVGPALRFYAAAVVALTGADMEATLETPAGGVPVPRFQALAVPAGSTLRLGAVRGPGSRAYLSVRGGLDVPPYLGSRATFTLGLFGGHGGRALVSGDVLHLGAEPPPAPAARAPLGQAVQPALEAAWKTGVEIAVLAGPHAAPDFFTVEDIADLYRTAWRVHHNSSRTGVRLIGPKPRWARPDGGEAGLHPSNIHDNAYAVGTLDFTGDMPVILGPDGPSLGGFVCPATIIEADLWKIGQLKAGDTVRFVAVSLAEARQRRREQEQMIETLRAPQEAPHPVPLPVGDGERVTVLGETQATSASPVARLQDQVTLAPVRRGEGRGEGPHASPILATAAARADRPAVVVRQDGDAAILVEYGPPVLDLALRFRAHALMQAVAERRLPGVIDLTPGIRSLHVHYDDRVLPREQLLALLAELEDALPATDEIEVPSRVVHLPLSWDDPACRLAINRYMQSVRPDAPWCPSNIEFIRRINGLPDEAEVRRIVFSASYLVLGLGDVYLGAPVATPLDPRHRLVTTKYNPARTWTPENAVGIGGAYLCVYGMEGPGGYQFVGRTCQMWNRFHETADFPAGRPWLLRFFDQIRFYPMDERELLEFRAAFPRGRVRLRMDESTFRFADYRRFLDENAAAIAAFRHQQRAAFVAERERWAALPPPPPEPDDSAPAAGAGEDALLPPGTIAVRAAVTGSVWEIPVAPGARVAAGDRLVVLETMKMETAVLAPSAGTVAAILCTPGTLVRAGQPLVALAE
jgi:urea carboxylase